MISPRFWAGIRMPMSYRRGIHLLILVIVTVTLQACYQDSPPSIPPQAVNSLVMLLGDRDWVIRRVAAEALGKIGDPRAMDKLVPVLGDESPAVREAASRSLGRLGPLTRDAALRLAALLNDSNPPVRVSAALSLGNGQIDQKVISAISATLVHDNSAARSAAISALFGLEHIGEAQEGLIRLVRDEDAQVRQWAVAVLGDTGVPHVVDTLLERLTHDVNAGVRGESAYRLGFYGGDAVRSGLTAAVNQDGSAQVRRWARQSLAGLTTQVDFGSKPRPARSDPSALALRSP